MIIMGLERNGHHPTIVTLEIHLDGDRQFIFNPNTTTSSSMASNTHPLSKLEAFFKLCTEDEFARGIKYIEVPEYYRWVSGEWRRRKTGGNRLLQSDGSVVIHSNTIGRIFSMSPKVGELYYLRLLLVHLYGPTSFTYLKTFNGNLLPTYKECCLRHGFLDNDQHITNGMNEISQTLPARKLREFFTTVMCCCEPSDPSFLWHRFADELCEDFILERRQAHGDFTLGEFQLFVVCFTIIFVVEFFKMTMCPLI